MGLRCILSLVVVIFLYMGHSHCKESQGCILLGERYQIGETKHPKLEDPNSNYCVTCKCNPRPNNGKPHLNCTSERCPTSCTDPTLKQCCNICSGDRKSMISDDSGNFSASRTDALYAPGPMSPPHQSDDAASPSNKPVVAQLSAKKKSFNSPCQSDGITYKDGSHIESKQPTEKPRTCNQCICNNGQVQCKLRKCPIIKCKNSIRTISDCCDRCPGTNQEENVSVTFPEKDTKDCPSGDRYYRNGATWHPIIGPFGEMSCVLCKCLSGRIECARLKCRRNLSCAKPAKVTGQCCPVCPSHQYEGNTRLSERSDLKNCLSSRAEVAVYKAEGAGLSSLVAQFAFVPLMVDYDANVEIRHHQIMTIKKNFENFRPLTIDLKSFEALRTKFSFILLGGTTKKHMAKFEKRLDRRWRKCKRTNAVHKVIDRSPPCAVHITKLISILKFKEVHRKDICGGGEIEVQI